jgi:preprotein translocase SecE subunit
MTSEQKDNGKDNVDEGVDPADRGELVRAPSTGSAAADAPSFFAIYKKGQGYWTRMCTAAGALLLVCLTAQFFYTHVLATVPDKNVRLGVAAGIVAVGSLLIWWLLNKPANTDFLIATDSEMKKVNWTSRSALIGSTKVVILFMFLISLFLFGIDLFFGYFFYFIGVLKTPPL